MKVQRWKIRFVVSALAMGITAAPADEPIPDTRPGLWEMQATMGSLNIKNGEKGIRICMTQQDILKELFPVSDGECTTQFTERTPKRWAGVKSCANPHTTMQSVANFESPETYSVKLRGVMMSDGRDQPIDMAIHLHHISDDCGDVNPQTVLGATSPSMTHQ